MQLCIAGFFPLSLYFLSLFINLFVSILCWLQFSATADGLPLLRRQYHGQCQQMLFITHDMGENRIFPPTPTPSLSLKISRKNYDQLGLGHVPVTVHMAKWKASGPGRSHRHCLEGIVIHGQPQQCVTFLVHLGPSSNNQLRFFT